MKVSQHNLKFFIIFRHNRSDQVSSVVASAALRLYPQVPINTRSTIKTTLLPKGGGPDGEAPVLVPRKAGITFSPYHMHRRKELFGEDANEYRPERWLDGSLSNIGYAYMPFLHGYRTCLGSMFSSFLWRRILSVYTDD
jgi:cytochrome P450